MISTTQLRELVIQPVLRHLSRVEPRLDRPEAVELLLGTAVHESTMGGVTYLRQRPNGPARSIWQIEPATHTGLRAWLRRRPDWLAVVDELRGAWPIPSDALYGSLYYACAMARVYYWRIPAALPTDPPGWARYWKRYYNTAKGKGRVQDWLDAYARYVESGKS